jgi:hypothetical protein
MPYKVGRSSNSKSSGSRVVVEPPQPVVETLSPVEETPQPVEEVPLSIVETPLPIAETPQPVDVIEPLFNEDRTKVMNPLTNRYVKVGGDIDKKLNLSNISF